MNIDKKAQVLEAVIGLVSAYKAIAIHENNIRTKRYEIECLKEEIEREERHSTQMFYVAKEHSNEILSLRPDIGTRPFVVHDGLGNQFIVNRGDYDVLYATAVPRTSLGDVLGDEVTK
jgi:hypothetical protein